MTTFWDGLATIPMRHSGRCPTQICGRDMGCFSAAGSALCRCCWEGVSHNAVTGAWPVAPTPRRAARRPGSMPDETPGLQGSLVEPDQA